MRCKYFFWLVGLGLLLGQSLLAETVTLRSGEKKVGTILMQNEQVLLLRDASGARFQYPLSEVLAITEDEVPEVQEEVAAVRQSSKHVSVSLQLAGGGAFVPSGRSGGVLGVDLAIGSYRIKDRPFFLGGTVGFRTVFLGDDYTLIPIRLKAEMPILEGKHTPLVGLAVGYGIATGKHMRGGLNAGVDAGWQYRFRPGKALALTAYCEFQNVKMPVVDTYVEHRYESNALRSLLSTGVRASLYF